MKLKFLAYVLLLFVFKQTIVLSENLDISVYTGTFDVIDKEGDDQTTLIGVEHRNTDLFRNTFLGKIAPVSGAFVTGKNSLYFYTLFLFFCLKRRFVYKILIIFLNDD